MTAYLGVLVAVAGVHLIATAVPGPNVLLVLRTALNGSRRDAAALTAGIAVSDAIWALAAMIGIGALFSTVGWLYTGVRIAGAGYLIYIGVQTWRSARTGVHFETPAKPRTMGRALRVGLLTNLTNPKSVIFFGSVFATTLPLEAPMGLRAAVIAIIVVNAVWFHGALTLVFSLGRAQQAFQRAKLWTDRAVGGLLVVFGVYILALSEAS